MIYNSLICNTLPSQTKLHLFIAELTISRRNICSILTKSLKSFRKLIQLFPIFKPKDKRTSCTSENNAGNQIKPINHVGTPFLFKFSLGSPNTSLFTGQDINRILETK